MVSLLLTATSNGEMDVNQDVYLIVYNSTQQIKIMVCESSCHFNWRDGCQTRCSSRITITSHCLLVQKIHFVVCLPNCYFKRQNGCQSRCLSDCLLVQRIQLFIVCLSSCQFKMVRWMPAQMFIELFTST